MENHFQQLVDVNSSVGVKYLSIFELKQIGNLDAIKALQKAFSILNTFQDRSCLLLHEIAYSFGQVSLEFSELIIPFLLEIMNDVKQFDVVRHEAAEALGNLSNGEHLDVFEYYKGQVVNDEQRIFADTCELAISKILTMDKLKDHYGKLYSGTREPAAPYTEEELQQQLGCSQVNEKLFDFILDPSTCLFNKYRALYYIRNTQNPTLIALMVKLLHNFTLGALLKHEICFILGQLSDKCPIEIVGDLIIVCENEQQPDIVRHEAFAAFQTIHTDQQICQSFLLKFVEDQSQIVRETVRVSIHVSQL